MLQIRNIVMSSAKKFEICHFGYTEYQLCESNIQVFVLLFTKKENKYTVLLNYVLLILSAYKA